ncbi:MAG: hypothetical protein Q9173_002547 [Seirophora scorigena]
MLEVQAAYVPIAVKYSFVPRYQEALHRYKQVSGTRSNKGDIIHPKDLGRELAEGVLRSTSSLRPRYFLVYLASLIEGPRSDTVVSFFQRLGEVENGYQPLLKRLRRRMLSYLVASITRSLSSALFDNGQLLHPGKHITSAQECLARLLTCKPLSAEEQHSIFGQAIRQLGPPDRILCLWLFVAVEALPAEGAESYLGSIAAMDPNHGDVIIAAGVFLAMVTAYEYPLEFFEVIDVLMSSTFHRAWEHYWKMTALKRLYEQGKEAAADYQKHKEAMLTAHQLDRGDGFAEDVFRSMSWLRGAGCTTVVNGGIV